MSHVLGSCSICGGDVVMPNAWYSVKPPVPTCERCGAKAVQHKPIIEMAPKAPIRIPMPEELGLESLRQTLHGIG